MKDAIFGAKIKIKFGHPNLKNFAKKNVEIPNHLTNGQKKNSIKNFLFVIKFHLIAKMISIIIEAQILLQWQ
jgi:hypothetical protein